MITRSTVLRGCSALPLTTLFFLSLHAETKTAAPTAAGTTRILQGTQPVASGGGALEAPTDLITDAQREVIQNEINARRERLQVAGKLAPTAVTAHPLFGWPLRNAAGISDPGYHGISNFVDLNPSYPDALLDYNCGARTYDRSDGYNHAGTDFFISPWSWRKFTLSEVEIVAAAPGQIVYRADGNYDKSCGFNNDPWNAIYVQHADGSIAWYGHMKSGSLTPKQVGDTVKEGEFLGVVGSSGNSTGPHLHFENHDAFGQLIEPWAGPCNFLNIESWWKVQRPYYDSGVLRMTTGDALVDFGVCPPPPAENPHAVVTFAAGASIFFTTYYHDQLNTQESIYTIYRPDGSIFQSWSHTSPVPHYAASYWWWNWSLSGEPEGTWRFTVAFQSTVTERQFTVGNPAACGSVPQTPVQGALLQVQRISSSLRLTWGASCNPQDNDYVIYEGAIGNFANYSPFRCTTSGNLVAVFLPTAGDRFYLVGPRNATREGSLGRFDNGAERPPGLTSCTTRLALQCP
jgi:murein DD-endopeptidase MepM/ murein hydrolase activator NlpD